ncbi:MAG: DUF6163 family protein [Rhizobiaceae bacterium]|nr:DUF6163 family protein [Rhizobiaceae bacterium]
MRDATLEKRNRFDLAPVFEGFLKLVSLFFIAFTLRHWLLIIGYMDPETRFDTLSTEWQTAVSILSVTQPVVAVGLWGAVSWGYVVWAIAVAVEVIMYVFLENTFGMFWPLIYFHASVASVMLLYLLIESLRARRSGFS